MNASAQYTTQSAALNTPLCVAENARIMFVKM